MISIRYSVLSIASALALAASTLSAQKPDVTFERAMSAYRDATTLTARFDQTVTNPLTDRALSSSGELNRQKPNLLSISFGGADPDRIVADGFNLWVYLPSSAPGQVIKMPATTAESGMLVDPLGQILTAPAGTYDIADRGSSTVGGRPTHAIMLTPRSRSALFSRATLWIDDSNGLVRQLESTEPSGLVRKITVKSVRTNVAIPRSTFRFTPPPNIRVIDGSGMGAR